MAGRIQIKDHKQFEEKSAIQRKMDNGQLYYLNMKELLDNKHCQEITKDLF